MFYLFVLFTSMPFQKWWGQYRPWQKVVGTCPTHTLHAFHYISDDIFTNLALSGEITLHFSFQWCETRNIWSVHSKVSFHFWFVNSYLKTC